MSIQKSKEKDDELEATRRSNQLKSAFLANMSHEIRTPLNAIVGFANLLAEQHQELGEGEVQEFASIINKNSDLLLALINDILDLSKIESGSIDFHYSKENIRSILQDIYDSQRLNMPPGVALKMDAPDQDKTIRTDPVRFKQVLNNLINNAAKFTASGSITFGYREEEEGYTTFFVADTGKGISAAGRQHIFERFYKDDHFTQGAGLGLSICQSIVDRFQGEIAFTSQKGKGTCFTVKIPDDLDASQTTG